MAAAVHATRITLLIAAQPDDSHGDHGGQYQYSCLHRHPPYRKTPQRVRPYAAGILCVGGLLPARTPIRYGAATCTTIPAMGISILDDDPTPEPLEHPVVKYLGRSQIAKRLGFPSKHYLQGVVMPPHDAEFGDRKGWTEETVDKWVAPLDLTEPHPYARMALLRDYSRSISHPKPKPTKFLGRMQIGPYLGLKSGNSIGNSVALPPHDAEIDNRKGWTTETIDAWQRSRPGKGRRGVRTGSTRTGMPGVRRDIKFLTSAQIRDIQAAQLSNRQLRLKYGITDRMIRKVRELHA